MNEPNDPISEMAAAAIQLHELFLAYVSAGFSEPQALSIVTAIVTASVGGTT